MEEQLNRAEAAAPRKRKLRLKCRLSPGDIVMLTAAVRDLHLCCPGQFITDVSTPAPAIWEHNPYVTRLDKDDPEVEEIECHYPSIHRSNQAPVHFVEGYTEYLGERLGVPLRSCGIRGHVPISEEEKRQDSQVRAILGQDAPFWIIVAGGKMDYTIKWWDTKRYQQVVDHFRGRILFVQVGEKGHHHPPLKGVLDLRGQTDTRELIRLVYHSQGVLCGVTFLMHLAAAVEVKGGKPKRRPCVVVAGGREPPHWEAYPNHQFIHTVGSLFCCDNGGCWKSRTRPLGDRSKHDAPEKICLRTVGDLPRCMDMITADEVIRRIQLYFDGGVCEFLTEEHRALPAMPWNRS